MTWTRLVPAAEVAPGTTRTVQTDDFEVLVCHLDPASCPGDPFTVIDDVCTHDGGPLGEGSLDGCIVRCPRHEGTFDARSGKARSFPAVFPVGTYPVRLSEDGWVEADLS